MTLINAISCHWASLETFCEGEGHINGCAMIPTDEGRAVASGGTAKLKLNTLLYPTSARTTMSYSDEGIIIG